MKSSRLASGPGLAEITGPTNSLGLLAVRITDSETFFLYHDFRRWPLAGRPPPMHAVRHDGESTVKRR